MKKYYTVVSKSYPKSTFNENTNNIDLEMVEFSKKVEITKYVKSSMIFNISIIAIWGITSIVLTLLWALLWIKSDPDLGIIPLSLLMLGAIVLTNTICSIRNTKQGYLDSTDFTYENLDQFFPEELLELWEHNENEVQKAHKWRKSHSLEERCRELIHLGNSNVLAAFIKPLIESTQEKKDEIS